MSARHFFVVRPVFSCVLATLTVLIGLVSMLRLPVTQYPDIAPPTITISAVYPGASAEVISSTVAQPIEEQVNGVQDMLYMQSTATNNGTLAINVVFRTGTDVDRAQVLVQNRVALAQPKLPAEVIRQGLDVRKRSPDLATVFFLYSPKGTYDVAYLSNYALSHVRDELARIDGVGDVQLFGAREYSIRVWLDPALVSSRGLTATDVAEAIREQNVQVAAGKLGQAPSDGSGGAFELTLVAQGRLNEAEDFASIVLKTGADGQPVRLRDVARVELGARDYGRFSEFSGKASVAVPTYLTPGANALETHRQMLAKMKEISASFPEDMTYGIYDTIPFIGESIDAVKKTLIEAVFLVVLVVVVFLQTWRASIIPLLAVPVSLIGTFAVLQGLGFGINSLTLFGLVLAIGIVVDDSIVVVENMERHIHDGMSPLEAAKKTVDEVGAAVVGIGAVLTAVFIPAAFITGISGEFYRQFAVTIATAALISTFNSLTMAPALGAILLRGHDTPKDGVQRFIDWCFGWFFGRFNRVFDRSGGAYAGLAARIAGRRGVVAVVYLALVGLTWLGFRAVPTGFVPVQDKGYFVIAVKLPDGASLERTSAVIKAVGDVVRDTKGVRDFPMFAGIDVFNGFAESSSAGAVFPILEDFDQRKDPALTADAIRADIERRLAPIQGAFIAAFPPPPVNGIGNVGGLKLQVQDRSSAGLAALEQSTQKLIEASSATPGIGSAFTTFRNNVPMLKVDVDRDKAKTQAVPLSNVYDTLQAYLGSLYVNDFTRFGRNFRVYIQADAAYRMEPEQIGHLQTRAVDGRLFPIASVLDVRESSGPEVVNRYNMYTAADINIGLAPGMSTGPAMKAIEDAAAKALPPGAGFEWTELSLQEKLAGNSAMLVFPLSVLLVYLALAALYESWTLPLSIIVVAPLSLLCSIGAVWLAGADNNIFTQIGFLVLLALGAKNAILIVEFAKQQEDAGMTSMAAVTAAARIRLRPILMTSLAFIFGVLPLVYSSGAGAEMRRSLGLGVFGGMIGVTVVSLLITPAAYIAVRGLAARFVRRAPAANAAPMQGV